MSDLIPIERIESKILVIRNQRVLLDRDLAELYEVPTKVLKQAVRRNIARFPEDFIFELTREEQDYLRSQSVTLKRGQHSKYLSMAFTEQGIAMLSSVLKSERAILVNVAIIRTFVSMRQMIKNDELTKARLDDLEDRIGAHEFQTLMVLDQLGAIKKKLTPQKSNKPLIGFPMPGKND